MLYRSLKIHIPGSMIKKNICIADTPLTYLNEVAYRKFMFLNE